MTRPVKPHEVVLDAADGLNHKTALNCKRIYLVPKARLSNHRGSISRLRRREICRKIAEVFRFLLG